MSKNLQFALIGCGMLGRVHANIVAQLQGARMAAFCDVSLQAAQNFAVEFQGDYGTDDLDRIWNDSNLDAVYICTRHESHTTLSIAAAAAEKHVLLEKPVGMSAKECGDLKQAILASNITFMPAFKFRFYPLVVKAREFIPTPQLVTAHVSDSRRPDNHWAQHPVFGGGSILGQGCHATDLLRYFADSEFKLVSAVGGAITHPNDAVLDHCAAGIQWENGHIASFINGDSGEAPLTGKFFFQLFGDGRSVEISNRGCTATFHQGTEVWSETRDSEEGFELENREFIAAIKEGRPAAANVIDGVEAMNLIFAIQDSIASGGHPIPRPQL